MKTLPTIGEMVAGIERQRLAKEKEAGLAASCNSTLRKLHELLEQEKEASRAHGVGAGGQPANVNAVLVEIERVKRMVVVAGKSHPSRSADRAGLQKVPRRKSWQDAQRNPARNKGRRTMGRAGGR